MAYPSLDEIKEYIAIPGKGKTDDGSEDALLNALLLAAKSFIESPEGTGRLFEVSADSTRRFDAVRDVDRLTLWLDQDLCAITSITNGDGTAVTNTQYVTEPRNSTPFHAIKLKDSATIDWTYDDTPEDAIVIVGRWGYSTSAPADIAHACRRLVVWLYRQRGSSADIDRPVVTGDGVTIMPSHVPSDIMAVLKARRSLT